MTRNEITAQAAESIFQAISEAIESYGQHFAKGQAILADAALSISKRLIEAERVDTGDTNHQKGKD